LGTVAGVGTVVWWSGLRSCEVGAVSSLVEEAVPACSVWSAKMKLNLLFLLKPKQTQMVGLHKNA